MAGAVADLSRSNAAWMSVRDLHLQLRFSQEKFGYGYQGGWGRFLTRGITKVKAETALSVLAYNILRAINLIGPLDLRARLG